jgi:single-strand DNA-binding protein
VAIESTTKEEAAMGRTRKPPKDGRAADVVELQPGIADQPPVHQGEEGAAAAQSEAAAEVAQAETHATDVPPDVPDAPEQPPAPASQYRGPALNRVELIGRIAKEPDVHVTPTRGTHVAYFRVATNGRETTEYHQVTAFGQIAEFVGEYLGVGRLVFIEGRLQTRVYTDRDGIRRWVTTIVVSRLQVLDSRRPDEQ